MMINVPEHAPFTAEQILSYWDDFTPDEAEWVAGDAMRLIEALETKFGISDDEAGRQVIAFLDRHETPAQRRG